MKIRQKPIASAVAFALMSVAFSAQSQQTDPKTAEKPADKTADPKANDKPTKLETVIVTGIRASQEKSLEVKRSAESHIDVITAEDIGKLPDKNVADSLQRVSGVTISSASANEGGFDESDRVSLRGTNPSLTQTLINGHSVAAGEWFVLNQIADIGRSVSYTLLPSELVSQVIVRKSSEANLVEGGVAGSIDIITRRPLDFAKPLTLEFSLGGVYAQLPKKTDPQVSALMNWKNDSSTFGVMVQGFSQKRSLRRDGVEVLGYGQVKPGSAVALSNPDLSGVFYPGLIGAALFEGIRKREGGLIDFEFKPTRDLTLDFSAFSSKLDASNYNRNYLLWPNGILDSGAGQAPQPGYVVRQNTLVQANFAPVAGKNYGLYDMISRPNETADSNFFAFDGRLRATDKLTFSSKLGISKGHGKTPTQDVLELHTQGSGGGYRLNGVDSAPSFNLGTANPASPSSVALDWIFGIQNVNIVDKENWAQLDGDFILDSGLFTTLRFGVRANTHERKTEPGLVAQRPNTFGDLTGPSAFNPANNPVGFQNYPGNFGSGLGGNFPTNVFYYSPAQLAAFNSLYTLRDPVSRRYYINEFAIKETNTAGYIQGNFEGKGFSGNIGLRLVQTKERVQNYVPTGDQNPAAIRGSAFGAVYLNTVNHTYLDPLPSANIKFDLNKDMIIRLAASRTMTRADYSALAAGPGLTPPASAGGIGSGTSGNPDLKPIRSTNFDATFEYYFAPRSLAQVTLFNMELKNYVGQGRVRRQFVDFSAANPQGLLTSYDLTVPINSKGSVKGVELSYEQPVFGNFGVATNFTYTDAHEQGGGPLVGASRKVYNVSGYYEDSHFNARLGFTHRSSFFSGLDRATAFYQDDVSNVTAKLGYKFSDNLSISLDMLNLNNPKLKYFADNREQPRSIYLNGRQFYLSASIKF
jgi:iron complex outermembrane recepter protein